MSIFPDTVKAALGGETVRMSYLVLMDFRGGPMRLWSGYGTLTSDGHDWSGLGELGAIGGLEQAINGEAPQATLTLSGVDAEIVTMAREEFATEAKGRKVTVYIQMHNDDNDQPLRLHDAPYPIWNGRMQSAQYEIEAEGLRRITVGCESLFALRSRPNFSQYTDRDQQARFPGDQGFKFVSQLVNKVITWPDF